MVKLTKHNKFKHVKKIARLAEWSKAWDLSSHNLINVKYMYNIYNKYMISMKGNLPSFLKKAKPTELVLGTILVLLISMTMNKKMPVGVKETLLSQSGILVSLVLIIVLFLNNNKVVGILGVLLYFILLQGGETNEYKNSYPENPLKIDAPQPAPVNPNISETLEEEYVRLMLPIANENNVSQPKYVATNSSKEEYKTV